MDTWVLALVATGVLLNAIAQALVSTHYADHAAQLVPWLRYLSSLAGAWMGGGRRTASPAPAQRSLLAVAGLLDLGGYLSFTYGFYACGPSTSNLVQAGASQVLSALAAKVLLQRRFNRGQLMALSCIFGGLLLRLVPLAWDAWAPGMGAPEGADPNALSFNLGMASLLLAALLYSALGLVYERLHRLPCPTLAHSQLLWHTSLAGCAATSAYQLVYTLPRRAELLGALPGAAPAWRFWSLAAALCAAFNVHLMVQTRVYRSMGALSVTLATAARGGVLALADALISQGGQAASPAALAAAAATVGGGVLWALAAPPASAREEPDGQLRRETTAKKVD